VFIDFAFPIFGSMSSAFSYNGVGCKSPKRKTIEPINDPKAVNYLLARFGVNGLGFSGN
jgi:hypothetical protein